MQPYSSLDLAWVPVTGSQDMLLYSLEEAAGVFLSDRILSIIPLTFLLAARHGPLVILSFADGSAFFNVFFGVVSRLYPLFYLTIKSVQHTDFSAYPAISSRDWILHLCLPTPKDNFLSIFHCFKEHNCSTSKKEIV